MEPLTAWVTQQLATRGSRAARRAAASLLSVGVLAAGGIVVVGSAMAGVNSGQAAAATTGVCGVNASALTPTPGGAGPTMGGVPLSAEQLANAATIVATGRQMGIPDQGLLVALITAMQESTLVNLDHGDRDSVGLFQQRPSQGWGSVEQIMQPAYAAQRFYQALQGVPGWQSMEPGAAAQAVQRSAFPTAYSPHISDAQALLGAVAGVTCVTDGPAGSTFVDGSGGTIILPKANPRSVEQAVAWAEQQSTNGSSNWYQGCLGFVANAYGWGFSGTPYAIDQYQVAIPASMHHDGDRNPPVGALLFWTTSHRAGHVAIYVGNGQIASNDIIQDGHISIVPATMIEQKWGAHYVGWAPPYFPGGG